MDAERDGAIPLTELANIARYVQESVDQIARSLSGWTGSGRPPEYLRQLSRLEAVAIATGSAVLQIEAPHDMEAFPLDLDQTDAGVQAVKVFVESLAALSDGRELPNSASGRAEKPIRSFLSALEDHGSVTVTSEADGTELATTFVPRLIDAHLTDEATPESGSIVEVVGRLYSVNLDKHSYRVRDELGRSQHFTLSDDLDQQRIARALLGETVRVTATTSRDEPRDPMQASAVARIESPPSTGYRTWDAASAIADVDPIRSIDDLAIPNLDEAEIDAFCRAVKR